MWYEWTIDSYGKLRKLTRKFKGIQKTLASAHSSSSGWTEWHGLHCLCDRFHHLVMKRIKLRNYNTMCYHGGTYTVWKKQVAEQMDNLILLKLNTHTCTLDWTDRDIETNIYPTIPISCGSNYTYMMLGNSLKNWASVSLSMKQK